MQQQPELIKSISEELAIDLPANIAMADLEKRIANEVNNLVEKNFQKLIGILYRMDVSEPKLKNLLANNPGTDAGIIIAQLMIERQIQKIKTRELFRSKNDTTSDEEKW